MRLTKMDMAKVIITALYNMPELVTKDNKVRWKEAQMKAHKRTVEELEYPYKLAHKILTDRIK